MEPKWSNFTKIGEESGFDLFCRKSGKGKNPEFAYRGKQGDMLEKEWGVAENLTDIKILAKERYWSIFGPGVVSGYRFSSPPYEEKYRDVVIGKYLYRDDTIALPRFMAKIVPRHIRGTDALKFWTNTVIVEGFTVAEVRKKIDHAIPELPKELQEFFPP